MRDGAELVNEEFFPLFRNVVTSLVKERGGVMPQSTVAGEVERPRRRLSGRQRLIISR